MKKHLIIAGVLALSLSFSGCGEAPQSPTEATSPTLATAPVHTPATPSEAVPHNDRILLSKAEPVTELIPLSRSHYDNGTYYYMDATDDLQVRCINSCYQTNLRSDETPEAYAQRRAIGLSASLSPGSPYGVDITVSQELTELLGYPVQLVSYFTGSDLDAAYWTVLLTQTEHYSYQYAFCASPEKADELEDAFVNHFKTLKLEPLKG